MANEEMPEPGYKMERCWGKRRVTRKEYMRLKEEFEVGCFMAYKGKVVWKWQRRPKLYGRLHLCFCN